MATLLVRSATLYDHRRAQHNSLALSRHKLARPTVADPGRLGAVTDEHKQALAFVLSTRDYYDRYHADKEREAYFIAIAYLGATAALLAANPSPLVLVGIIGATVLAVVLVAFQLYNRWVASRMGAACAAVAADWLAQAPPAADYGPVLYKRTRIPSAVKREVREQAGAPALVALVLIPAVLFAWGVLTIACRLPPGGLHMQLELWLTVVALALGFVSALLMAEPWGKFRAAVDPWIRRIGPCLLAVAFLLQIVALGLPLLCR
jgi:hypothetical protein